MSKDEPSTDDPETPSTDAGTGLSGEEVEEVLARLAAELHDQYDETEPFGGLNHEHYEQVTDAQTAVANLRAYLQWRDDRRD